MGVKKSLRVSQQLAVAKWNKAHYTAKTIYLPKGSLDLIKQAVDLIKNDSEIKSVNAYIVKLIDDDVFKLTGKHLKDVSETIEKSEG